MLYAALDICPVIVQLVPHVLAKLQGTFGMAAATAEQQERQAELQGLLCGVLQIIIQKLNPAAVEKAIGRTPMSEAQKGALKACSDAMLSRGDDVMMACLAVFRCRSATVHEEALLAVGALVDATGPGFRKYMDAFYPFLEQGLKNHEQYAVCNVTVAVVGDLCRALNADLAPYCDSIVTLLLQDLQSNELHKSVKPSILSAFGDLALALGPAFDKYLAHAVGMLESAAAHSLTAAPEDEEAEEYNVALQNGILEAYAGILQGLKDDKAKVEPLRQHAPRVLAFIEALSKDEDKVGVFRNAIAVLGDMAEALDGIGQVFQQNTFYQARGWVCFWVPPRGRLRAAAGRR